MTARGSSADVAALKSWIAGLPDALQAEAGDGLELVGEEVLGAARAALATGGHDPSGRLAASLSASVDRDAARLTIRSSSPYAAFVEFGTRRRAARPFLRPAVVAAEGAALQHLRDALGRATRRLKGKP